MYNEEYLVQIEEAIKKLQNGERVVSIAYGDHVVRYAEVQINDLLSLRQRIKAELKVADVKPKRKLFFQRVRGLTKLCKNVIVCGCFLLIIWLKVKKSSMLM